MRTPFLILVLVAALLLLNGEVLAMSGGGYILSEPNWQVNGNAGGGGYQLSAPSEVTADICCCIYMPCVLR